MFCVPIQVVLSPKTNQDVSLSSNMSHCSSIWMFLLKPPDLSPPVLFLPPGSLTFTKLLFRHSLYRVLWSYLIKCVRLHQFCGSMWPMSRLKSSPQTSTSHCRRDSLQGFLGWGGVGSMLKLSAAEGTRRGKEHSIYRSCTLRRVCCLWYSDPNETWQRWMFLVVWFVFLYYLWAV